MIDERLARPRAETVRAVASCPGDVVVLGAGGKMGPSLCLMLRAALREAGSGARVIAVSRWSNAGTAAALEARGVETVAADLLDRRAVAALPDAPNVIFMAGQKFGTTEVPYRTWAMNVLVPSFCAERYAGGRIVAFSTGNVYSLMSVAGRGSAETDAPGPRGDYAASCLGRERIFERAAGEDGTRVAIVRLNYAVEWRYGVLLDIAQRVAAGTPVNLSMGWVNVIWQEDANQRAIECLPLASAPPFVVNVTGAEALRVRDLATAFGERLGTPPHFEGIEGEDALLSDTTRMRDLLGAPATVLTEMLDTVAAWVRDGGETLRKPTHFEARDGRF